MVQSENFKKEMCFFSLLEGPWRRAEGLDESGLVLLPEQPQYEALLARLCRLLRPHDEDAGDEVDWQPLHQHVDHENPRGDEEDAALLVSFKSGIFLAADI